MDSAMEKKDDADKEEARAVDSAIEKKDDADKVQVPEGGEEKKSDGEEKSV